MKINENELIKKAKEALKNSYSNYSHFKVGAAIELKDGNFIIGTNIENASFGLTNCAERSALFAAYSLGYRKEDIIAMSIATESNKMVSPCGACRQVMAELILPDTPVYLVYGKENVSTFKTSIKELLPYSFGEDDLNV
mgnify:CR=1 FL=1